MAPMSEKSLIAKVMPLGFVLQSRLTNTVGSTAPQRILGVTLGCSGPFIVSTPKGVMKGVAMEPAMAMDVQCPTAKTAPACRGAHKGI